MGFGGFRVSVVHMVYGFRFAGFQCLRRLLGGGVVVGVFFSRA